MWNHGRIGCWTVKQIGISFCFFLGFNVQYKPTFSDAHPIWFLGRGYHIRNVGENNVFRKKEPDGMLENIWIYN